MEKQACRKEDSVQFNLQFIRHTEKTRSKDEYPLTNEGQNKAKELGEVLGCRVVASSPVERAQLTASYLSNPQAENDLGFEEHQEIKRKNKSPRVRTIKEIGFNMGRPGDAFYDDCMNAYKNNALSRFYIEESDKYLEKNPNLSTYTTVAGNFAELILKYCRIRNYADDMKNGEKQGGFRTMDKDGNMKKFNISKEVNRLFVSHGGTLEFFLYKVIEDKEGRDGLLKFIEENHLEMQVNYLEGYNVKINKDKIDVEFRGKTYEITQDFLEKLVKERDELIGKNTPEEVSKE